jgi:hypothetical protein
MPRLRRLSEAGLDLAALRQDVAGWYAARQQSKAIENQLNRTKKQLQALVQEHGEREPVKGHIFLSLEESVGDRRISKLKNECSTTTGLNEEAAEEILKAKGLWDEMVEMVPVLDQSKVFAAHYDNKITEDELGRMFPQRITYRLIMLDDEDKPVY